MQRFIRNTLHPEVYHGDRKAPPFFEGWYFKIIDSTGQHRYAIIPGVFLSDQAQRHHAFIQVLNGLTGSAKYHRFPGEAFNAAAGKFNVHIDHNFFSTERIQLDINNAKQSVKGELRFKHISPWPVTLTSPGIMGWYAWVPFMECYHGVLSLDHEISGKLTIDGQNIDFTGGRGYIEKDWGKSFPSAWVWMQSNHFAVAGTSFTASVAMIPWVGRSFRGFIVGLWHDGVLYRMATYTGARIETLEISEDDVQLTLKDRRYQLQVRATRPTTSNNVQPLYEPTTEHMLARVVEDMRSEIALELSETRTNTVIFSGVGQNGAIEVQGDLARLLSEK